MPFLTQQNEIEVLTVKFKATMNENLPVKIRKTILKV